MTEDITYIMTHVIAQDLAMPKNKNDYACAMIVIATLDPI